MQENDRQPAYPATPQTRPAIGVGVWVMSTLICLMFMGMMHDFRSAGQSHDEKLQEMLDTLSQFENDVSAALPERKMAFVLAAALAVYCWGTLPGPVRIESPLLIGLILAALAWTCVSWLWSIDPHKTSRELLRIVVFFALASGLAMRYSPAQLCWIVLLSSTMTVAVACGYEVFSGATRDIDGVYRLAGSLHPNPLGRFATMMVLPALAYWRRLQSRHWLMAALVAVGLVVILLTKSRTALASCIVGIVMIYWLAPGWRRLLLPAAMATTVVAGYIITIGIGGQALVSKSGDALTMGREDKVGSLTGRLPLWETLLRRSEDRRIEGFGYGAFWTTANNEAVNDEVQWIPGHAHSGYVETLIGLGVVGLGLLLVIAFLSTTRCIYKAVVEGSIEHRILAAIMLAALVNSFTEGGFVLPRELAIFSMMFAVSAALPRYREQAPKPAIVMPHSRLTPVMRGGMA